MAFIRRSYPRSLTKRSRQQPVNASVGRSDASGRLCLSFFVRLLMPRSISRILLIVVACFGVAWAAHPFLSPPQGLHSTGWSYADLIRDRYPIHLVNPAWLTDDMNWDLIEMGARLGVVAIGFVCVFVTFRRHEKPAA